MQPHDSIMYFGGASQPASAPGYPGLKPTAFPYRAVTNRKTFDYLTCLPARAERHGCSAPHLTTSPEQDPSKHPGWFITLHK